MKALLAVFVTALFSACSPKVDDAIVDDAAVDDAAVDDSPTADATPAFEGDPEGPGSFGVHEAAVMIPGPAGNIVGTIYAPSTDGGTTIATEGAPYPLVIVMHGFTASHGQYATFSRHFASWGYVAVGIDFGADEDHDRDAREAIAVIDWAKSASPAANVTDTTRVATAGHSLGGKIAFFAAALDPRITAVIGWDPVDSGGAPCFIDPVNCHKWSVAPNSFDMDEGLMDQISAANLIFAAPVGVFNPEEHHARRFWEGTRAPALWVLFPAGAHTNWPTGNPEERISKRTQIAWLAKHFRGQNVEPYLSGDVINTDAAAGRIIFQSK